MTNRPASAGFSFIDVITLPQIEEVSLTDIYAAAEREGLAGGKQSPSEWKRREGEQFIAFVAETLNVAERHIYVGSKGN
jgi:hypothetical protein